MGISKMIARAILHEHRYKPIDGNGLFIGRQTLPFTLEEGIQMIKEEEVLINPRTSFFNKAKGLLGNTVDEETRYGKGHGYVKDSVFFSLFSNAKFLALDVTDYEGAEIVHNMHEPVPERLHNSVDFMFNGSCLDNMSDPMAAMRNTAKMLKPGGRVALMEMASHHHNPYLMFSPAWFFDFFAVNNFTDCKVYVCLFDPTSWGIHHGPYDLFRWKNYEATVRQFPFPHLPSYKAALTYVIAEKGTDSTWDKVPVQGQYRPDHEVYKNAFERFNASPRPIIKRKPSEKTMDHIYNLVDTFDIEFLGSLEE